MIGRNNLEPLFQPIRRNIKISRDLVEREFPRLPPASPALSSDWFPQRRPPSRRPAGIYTWEECVQKLSTTINDRTKEEKNQQNKAVLS